MNNLILVTIDLFCGNVGEMSYPNIYHLENDMEQTMFFNDIYAKLMIPTSKQVISDFINQIFYQHAYEGFLHFDHYTDIVEHYIEIYEHYYESVYGSSLSKEDSDEIKEELKRVIYISLDYLKLIPELHSYHCYKVEFRGRLMLCFMITKTEVNEMSDEEIFLYLKTMGWLQ